MLSRMMFPVAVWVSIGFAIYFICYFVVFTIAEDFFKKDLKRNPILEMIHVLLQVINAVGVAYYFAME